MSEIKRLLEGLEDFPLLEAKETFTKDELTPVLISSPKGKATGLPKPSGEVPDKVEIIPTGKPEGGEEGEGGEGKEGEEKEGESGGKPSEKEGEGKSKGKPQPGSRDKKGTPSAGASEGERKTEKFDEKKIAKGPKARPTVDSHDFLGHSDAGEAKDMAEKILAKAEEARKERNTGGEPGSEAGGYMEKLRDLHKPKIDWAGELRKKVTEFKSRTASTINKLSRKPTERYKEGEGVQKNKSYITYLKDPRSHAPGGKIIFKGPYVKAPISEIVLIVALDTSGSIGADTIAKVFGEMDKIAMGFKRGFSAGAVKLEGRVYFMVWDTEVHQAMEYKAGDWKQFVEGKKGIAGRGGTDIKSVFDFIKQHTLYDSEKPGAALLNLVKKPNPVGMSKDDVVIPVKGEGEEATALISPFLIIATDGAFGSIGKQDLGLLFKDNLKNILYLIIDGTSEYCYPKNVINYETYRI